MSAGRRSPTNIPEATHMREVSSAARSGVESTCAIAAPAWHTHSVVQSDSCASSQSEEASFGAIRNSAIIAIATAFTTENMKQSMAHETMRVNARIGCVSGK